MGSVLSKICEGILRLLDFHLIPSSMVAESKVFYLKIKDGVKVDKCTFSIVLRACARVVVIEARE